MPPGQAPTLRYPHVVTIRFDDDTMQGLTKVAVENDRTIAAELRRAARFYLDGLNEKKAA